MEKKSSTWDPEIQAGIDLDRRVATEVLGRTICEHSKIRSVAQSSGWAMCTDQACKGELHWEYVPQYSLEIFQAWKIVEFMKEEKELNFDLHVYVDHEAGLDAVQARFTWGEEPRKLVDSRLGGTLSVSHLRGEATANTAPHAICLAALRAVGKL